MKLLKVHGVGAGLVVAREEERGSPAPGGGRWSPGQSVAAPMSLYRSQVQPSWVDYNGHMADAFYLWAFGEAGEDFFRFVGIDAAYRAAGASLYTVETHLNYYKEMHNGDALRVDTQLVGVDDKRLHLFHRMFNADDQVVATNEIMLLNVDTGRAKAAPIAPAVTEALAAVWAVHKDMPAPKELGHVMQVKGRAASA